MRITYRTLAALLARMSDEQFSGYVAVRIYMWMDGDKRRWWDKYNELKGKA